MHCFKSKCKCVGRPEGDGCERCHRLSKQCHPADSIRRRQTLKAQNSSARIAQLEGKLDGLVSLLQSVSNTSDTSAALREAFNEDGMAAHCQIQQPSSSMDHLVTTSISCSQLASTTNTDTAVGGESTPAATSPQTPLSSSLGADGLWNTCALYEPSADEAETHLSVFCSQMLPYLPFIYLPPSFTSQQLRQDKPFLFRAIVAVVSTSTQQKQARGKELKRILAQTALYESQSSIDLLLGLLTYVAWGYDQFLTRSGTLSRLMMLAMSQAYDLRLNKPLPPDVHMVGPLGLGFDGCYKDALDQTNQHSLEPQRALLGCFLLSSIVSSYFAQIDAMRWTARMEECLRALETNKDSPTDGVFAFQVRLQLLAQRAVQVREQQESCRAHVCTAAAETPLPTFLYLKALNGQLQELKNLRLPSVQQQGRCIPCIIEILIAHTHYIELCINETAHTANSNAPLLPVSAAASSGNNLSGFERLEVLCGSMTAIKSWLDVFFTLSPSSYLGLSFLFWAQLTRCLVVLYRLSTYSDPAWDRKAVRDTVDLLLSLDQMIEKLELANRTASEPASDDLFMLIPRMMRMFRAWAGAKIAPEEAETESWPYGGTMNADDETVDQYQEMMQSIDFGNDMWFEEVFCRR